MSKTTLERGDVVLIDLGSYKYIGIVLDAVNDGFFKVAWNIKPGDWFHSRAAVSSVVRIGAVPFHVEWDL